MAFFFLQALSFDHYNLVEIHQNTQAPTLEFHLQLHGLLLNPLSGVLHPLIDLGHQFLQRNHHLLSPVKQSVHKKILSNVYIAYAGCVRQNHVIPQ